MAPKNQSQTGKRKAEEAESQGSKKARLAAEAVKAKEAADKRIIQSTLHTLGSKPNASDGQKGALTDYKAQPKGAAGQAKRDEILKKFAADKKCTWWQEVCQENTDVQAETAKGLKGHGTRHVDRWEFFIKL